MTQKSFERIMTIVIGVATIVVGQITTIVVGVATTVVFCDKCGWCCDNRGWLWQLWTLRQLWSHHIILGHYFEMRLKISIKTSVFNFKPCTWLNVQSEWISQVAIENWPLHRLCWVKFIWSYGHNYIIRITPPFFTWKW